jgi:hypothetical protein
VSRPPIVERWRRAVFRDRRITDSPRVLALALADVMDERGYVTIDRAELAEQLGVYRTRADERLKALRDAGLLVRVQAPAPHRPAVWRLNFTTEPAPVEPVHERAPVEAGTYAHRPDRCTLPPDPAPALPVHVSPANPPTSDTTCTGSTGARPIETPDQDDPWAAGAHPLRTAAAQTKDAATDNDNDGLSALGRALRGWSA